MTFYEIINIEIQKARTSSRGSQGQPLPILGTLAHFGHFPLEELWISPRDKEKL